MTRKKKKIARNEKEKEKKRKKRKEKKHPTCTHVSARVSHIYLKDLWFLHRK